MKRLVALTLLLSIFCACTQTQPAPSDTSYKNSQDVSQSMMQSSAQSKSVLDLTSQPQKESSMPTSEPQTVSAPESAVVQLAQGPESSYPLTWWEVAFCFDTLNGVEEIVESVKLHRYSDQVSITVADSLAHSENPYDFSYLDALSPVQSDDIGELLPDLSMLEILETNDTKYTYRLYERGLEISKLLPGEGGDQSKAEHGENMRFSVDPAAYETMLTSLRARMEDGSWVPTWLAVMRQSNAERIAITSSDGKHKTSYDREDGWKYDLAFSSMQRIQVDPKTTKRIAVDKTLKNAAHVQIEFFNGIRYNIWHDGKAVIVASSDMDYALEYHTDSAYELEELNDMAHGQIIPPTAKPVIYLYPEQTTDVSVKLRYKGEFTYTYPTYKGGWNVTAHPDGRLINKTDGSEHFYLFWEGNADVDWRFEEGFVVRGQDAERFLVKKLAYLGLTPREYNDFIVYWLPELQQNEYNLITFSTEQYEALAPLEISPQPDSMLRVHMVYKKLSTPVTVKPQTLKPFARKGFTVVEWGGSRA
ncbi:hypothetical protein V6615_02545 [Oscillospiraceae bacterium PP1C4]